MVIAASAYICESSTMKYALVLFLPAALGGCSVAKTAFDVVTLPVKVVSAGVDAVTTSQSKSDQKRGRQLRKEEEERGRQARLADARCRKGRPLPNDSCPAPVQR
jgi:hypothetical protein